jgi:hypothetical protein
VLALVGVVIGCTSADPDPTPPPEQRAQAEPEAAVEPEAEPEPEPEAEPEPEPEAEPEPEPEPPSFDPLTVEKIRARIVAFDSKHWVACGVVHSVGGIEVEVLGVGEPPPRMGLYVSCPADFGHREFLEVGKVLDFTLHARKQPWPKPAARLPEDLPHRYVKSIALAVNEELGNNEP